MKILIPELKKLIALAEFGETAIETAQFMKSKGIENGDMFEYNDDSILHGRQFVIVGMIGGPKGNSQFHGIGLNNDHNGYIYPDKCKRITYKNIKQ